MLLNYHDIECLRDLYLEDSYVLNIIQSEAEVIFVMEFVLTEKHLLYTKPIRAEQYCYKNGRIRFIKPKLVKWIERSKKLFVDKAGNKDLGNIDAFTWNGEQYLISGDWGVLRISSEELIVEYAEAGVQHSVSASLRP